ncbi:hypothetical protein CALCODRAFT_507943 [Calocera cornea HHB12733]|uniref:Uncharacterized protein n=1 Tax=Calocera cornea HHB12733 TaxID=1353952 RepID=A0A165H3A6_9BASI|nr:hypothetical protein CALCODRAFT_507943 [Calocera cornea HHB12733]
MQIFSFFLLLSLLSPIFALPTPERITRRAVGDDLTEYLSARDFDLTELPNGDVLYRRDLEARFYDDDEEAAQDLYEREFDEEDVVQLEDRSKIGNKIKNFFKKVGNGIKKAVSVVAKVATSIIPVGRVAKVAIKSGEAIAKAVDAKKNNKKH